MRTSSPARIPLILLAASGLAREVMASRALAESFDLLGVLDDDRDRHGRSFGPTTVLGPIDEASSYPDAMFVVCTGQGQVRERIVTELESRGVREDRFASIIDPSAVVAPGCAVGAGSVLLAHVTLTADVTVGRHVVIMPQAVLTHDNRIEDYATICSGVALGGSVVVGTAAYLGMSSSVRQNLRIGDRATLGMGSVLLRDLPAGRTWVGAPAADIGDRPTSKLMSKNGDGQRPAAGDREGMFS